MNAIDRANKAKAILDNPMYEESFELCRQAIIHRIENTSLTDTQTAEDLRRCLKLLRDVRANLIATLNSGKVEQFRLQEEQKRRDNPFRNLFR